MDDKEIFLDWIWEQYHISDDEYNEMSTFEQDDLWEEFEEYMELY